jgi:hypothetical protein
LPILFDELGETFERRIDDALYYLVLDEGAFNAGSDMVEFFLWGEG